MFRRFRQRQGLAAVVILTLVMLLPATSAANEHDRTTVVDVKFLGEVVVPTGEMFAETEIGGLSSITHDTGRGVYYALSDDQGNRTDDPVRHYTIEIDFEDGTLDDGDVGFVDVSTVFDSKKMPFAPGGVDPEGWVLARQGFFYMSSEGNIFADPIIDPFIRRYNPQGRATSTLPIPDHYIPNGIDWGVRFNLAFESLNTTPDGRTLVTAAEGSLFQDGPASSFDNTSLARMLTYDIESGAPVAEFAYEVDKWAEPSAIFGVNGIVEVLPIDDVGTMLVMERSFSVGGTLGGGTGNVVSIYEVSTAGATDVLDIDSFENSPVPIVPVSKRLVFAFDDIGIPIDNIEGMTFGPDLADGRKALVIVSDNNFSPAQFTQFILLAVDLQPAS